MPDRDPKILVGGSRPVNRRTAPREATAPKLGAVVMERARAAKARNRLGASLAEQLRAPAARAKAPVTPMAVSGGILAACGAVGLFLAWLQAAPLVAVGSGGAVAGGLALLRAGRRAPAVAETPATPLFDPASVEGFDRAVQQLAADLPADVAQALLEIKQLAVRMARHAGTPDEYFQLEDRLYCNECLRRYLPDSLQAWLAVPAGQRDAPLAEGRSAQALLLQQLAQLRAEMEKREHKLARGAAEALLRQQRFLDAKR
jgi:hypothetical protein